MHYLAKIVKGTRAKGLNQHRNYRDTDATFLNYVSVQMCPKLIVRVESQ